MLCPATLPPDSCGEYGGMLDEPGQIEVVYG